MSFWQKAFELSGGLRRILEHLRIRDFSRTSCRDIDVHLRLDWDTLRSPNGGMGPTTGIKLGDNADAKEVRSAFVEPVGTRLAAVKKDKVGRGRHKAAEQIAVRGLAEAVVDCGETTPASKHIPANIRIVTIDPGANPAREQFALQGAFDGVRSLNRL